MPQLTQSSQRQTGQKTAMQGYASRSLIIIIAFGIVLIAAISFAIYFYFQYQSSQAQLERSSQANQQSALLNQIGKLIVLPSGEQPQIATVSDMAKLKGQSFFAHAKNGDKVLIYTKAQEAILYDPIANKIVAVGPISLTQVTPTTPVEATPEPVDVALYNGTTTVGLAETVDKELVAKMPNITVVSRTDAVKSTYTSTLIIDQTGKNASVAASLAKLLGGKVGKLPSGEEKAPNADLLVILGK
jgi:LytR cell envelope-related transcriptional attenuator